MATDWAAVRGKVTRDELKQINAAAEKDRRTTSAFVRAACMEKVQRMEATDTMKLVNQLLQSEIGGLQKLGLITEKESDKD